MNPAFDPFAPGAAAALFLFGARVSGLVLVAPLFSGRPVPAMVRAGLIVAFTILMVPVATRTPVPATTVPAVLSEALVGFTIGIGAAFLVGAAEAAGELLGIQIGLQGSALVDPLSMQQSTATGQFLQLFAVTLLLTLNAHLVMLDALRSSAELIPVGTAGHLRDGLWRLVTLGGQLFVLGLRFAAPVIAVVLLITVALAVLGRAAPQLNILSLAFPIQIIAGLAALLALVPIFASWFLGWEGTYDAMLSRVLPAIAGGTR
ncbi:MAG: flagellar biosynthetic protein FliR [Gemmatimonadetes bacterium]|nr:flagellar biosynthetic protein FliR [Gemmatimonadota bacterium]